MTSTILQNLKKSNSAVNHFKLLGTRRQFTNSVLYSKHYAKLSNAKSKYNHIIMAAQTQPFATQSKPESVEKKEDKDDNVNVKIETTTTVSLKEKLKQAIKEYGTTVIVFHVSISIISLGSSYLLISNGVDVNALLVKYLNFDAANQIASNAGTFAIAYAVHKVFAPVRMLITLTATPFIVKYLRRIGFIKHNAAQP